MDMASSTLAAAALPSLASDTVTLSVAAAVGTTVTHPARFKDWRARVI